MNVGFATRSLFLVVVAMLACQGNDVESRAEPVQVALSEFRFESSRASFEAGKPYRFVLENRGSVAHEWAVVPRGRRDESDVLIEVEEGELPPSAMVTQEFTFPRAGEYDFACFVPGHYEAGMVLPVTIR